MLPLIKQLTLNQQEKDLLNCEKKDSILSPYILKEGEYRASLLFEKDVSSRLMKDKKRPQRENLNPPGAFI
jgi:hypothetical protein